MKNNNVIDGILKKASTEFASMLHGDEEDYARDRFETARDFDSGAAFSRFLMNRLAIKFAEYTHSQGFVLNSNPENISFDNKYLNPSTMEIYSQRDLFDKFIETYEYETED